MECLFIVLGWLLVKLDAPWPIWAAGAIFAGTWIDARIEKARKGGREID